MDLARQGADDVSPFTGLCYLIIAILDISYFFQILENPDQNSELFSKLSNQ